MNVGQITDGGANEGDQVDGSTGKRITGDAPRLYFSPVDVVGGGVRQQRVAGALGCFGRRV